MSCSSLAKPDTGVEALGNDVSEPGADTSLETPAVRWLPQPTSHCCHLYYFSSIPSMLVHMTDDDGPTIIYSPLRRRIEGDGTYIDVQIYRGESEANWLLEVVDEENASTVYDDQFATDQAALDEVMASIQKYGIRVYLDNGFPDDSEPIIFH